MKTIYFNVIFFHIKIPELNEMGTELEKANKLAKYQHQKIDENTMSMFSFKMKLRNFVIQNAGILIGFFLMLILAFYADKMVID